MKKVSYVELQSNCYCRCICCSIYNAPKQEHQTLDEFKLIADNLKDAGFNRIRLAGRDPIASKLFSAALEYTLRIGMEADVATTLLTKDQHVVDLLADVHKLRVSVIGAGKFHNDCMRGGDKAYDQLRTNLHQLLPQRPQQLLINYTLVDYPEACNYTQEAFNALKKFHDEFAAYDVKFMFFSAIVTTSVDEEDPQVVKFYEQVREHFSQYVITPAVTVKSNFCTIMDRRLYVRSNGEVYPCCLSGGEIGQNLVPELCLGNAILSDISGMIKTPLTGLDNHICDACSPKFYADMRKLEDC